MKNGNLLTSIVFLFLFMLSVSIGIAQQVGGGGGTGCNGCTVSSNPLLNNGYCTVCIEAETDECVKIPGGSQLPVCSK